MNFNLRLIQVFSDALIPVLGYLFWEWDLFFIVLYYLLDLFVSESFMHFKSRKIRLTQGGGMMKPAGYILTGIGIIISVLYLLRIFFINLHPEMNMVSEAIEFWKYKDLGIQQGYLLLPLLALIGYQRYKAEFIKPELHKKLSLRIIWMIHYRELLLLMACAGLITAISFFILFPEWVYLIILLGVTSAFKLRR